MVMGNEIAKVLSVYPDGIDHFNRYQKKDLWLNKEADQACLTMPTSYPLKFL